MSSAISIENEPGLSASAEAPAEPRRSPGEGGKPRPTSARQEPDAGFRVWHFFVLLSLLAATAAVVVTRQGRPEVLILVSLTIGAAGAAAFAFYRMLAPLTATDASLIASLIDEPLSAGLRRDLEREKALTLRSIKELEFDRAMGKVSSQDFDEMAGRLRARAIGILKQLDADRSPYRAVIEKELAARLAAAHVVRPAPPGPAKSACVCGTVNDDDARFCKSCGAKLGHGTRGTHGIEHE